uniref:NADH-ubiquinone oxidoreductase chain 4L n=1 Tax=Exothotettix guangxiensis TaxID=3068914 RepID=A0AA51UA48_9ORTH|nr:NADH dehydrogenase subunit 4L [Exothotettix guangxiensis]WMV02062.1 NADH dehydrogenase subunit 4L [Exothotettix guangxiensis]
MSLMLLFFFMIFLSGLYIFSSFRKHLLLMLLGLECMVLSIFYYMFLYLSYFNYEDYFLIIFLIFSVCEGALGLSVLVSLVRSCGNDHVFSSSLFVC